MTNSFLENLPELELPNRGEKQDQVIYYAKVRCPGCGSHKAPVRNTKPPAGGHRVRYHRCSECGLNFKSVEAYLKISLDRHSFQNKGHSRPPRRFYRAGGVVF